jgi:hypothetical protein
MKRPEGDFVQDARRDPTFPEDFPDARAVRWFVPHVWRRYERWLARPVAELTHMLTLSRAEWTERQLRFVPPREISIRLCDCAGAEEIAAAIAAVRQVLA